MKPGRLNILKRLFIGGIIGFIGVLIISPLQLSGYLYVLNDLLYDQLLKIRFNLPVLDTRIQMVSLDQSTLNKFGKWPWKDARSKHARLLNILNENGAKVILFNFLPSEPDTLEDKFLINTLKKYKNIVLPVYYDYNNNTIFQPYGLIANEAAALGNSAVITTNDGITRQADIKISDGKNNYWAIALEVFRLFESIQKNNFNLTSSQILNIGEHKIGLDRNNRLRINFRGLNVYPVISYYSVLEGRFPPDIFKNKIVLVGADFIGSGDFVSIPISPGALVPTIHVQAQLISNILNQQTLYSYPVWMSLIIITFLGILTGILLKYQKNIYGQIYCFLSVIVISLLVSYALLNYINLIIDIIPFLFTSSLVFFAIIIEEIISTNILLTKKHEELTNTYNELQSTQEQLIQAEKMSSLGILSAGIAHEINNPLNYLAGNMKVLNNNMSTFIKIIEDYEKILITEDVKDKIQKIKEDNDFDYILGNYEKILQNCQTGLIKIRDIINNLLTFSRKNYNTSLKSGDIKDLVKVNLHEIIEIALDLLKHEYKDRIGIHKNYDSGNIELFGYSGQLEQVFMNILLNACQAIEQKGEIWIETSKNKEYVLIEISNSGPPISEEIINKIFDPFFTTKKVGKGTGLGLSLVYNIIKKHNGEIRVENNNNGNKKVTFKIKLPLKNE